MRDTTGPGQVRIFAPDAVSGSHPARKNRAVMNSIAKLLTLTGALLLTSATVSHAQIKNARVDTVHVYGNCGMCESTIEKSVLKKGVAEADWDRGTKMAVVTYDSTKTNLKEIMKRVADAGYDNEFYTAPDAVYDKLHMCCKYERKPAE